MNDRARRPGFALGLLALLLAGLIVSGCGGSSGEATAASFPGGDPVPSRPAPAIDLTTAPASWATAPSGDTLPSLRSAA